MKEAVAFLTLLSAIGSAFAGGNITTADAVFTVRFGDKFGDGWDGADFTILERPYNSSYVVTDRDYQGFSDSDRYHPEVGGDGLEGDVECASDQAIYFALLGKENNTLLMNLEPPIQYWEIYWEIVINGTVYHGGWNTRMAFSCDGNYTLLDWSENLLEPLGSCPECQHPKPKPKPKPKGGKDDDDHHHRRLGADDDDKKDDKKKGKRTPPMKYWPVPIKLMDPTDRDGWFDSNNMAYAEYTISDSTRMNLLAEGTLCAAKGTDGYSTVCETMLPDGHYIFRASGNLDDNSGNYTWQLCGKEAVKYEIGMTDPAITGKNATMQYDYRSATGFMGNEVAFEIKKGKCIVDETIVDLADYINGTALDTVVTLDGHLLLENVHFSELSAAESAFLEADINEFVSLDVEKMVTVTSVENVNDGTLVGFRVVASHAESQLMSGTMEGVISSATATLQSQISSGGFLNFMKNSIQAAGMGDDKLMDVGTVQFVDLEFENFVTLRNGETMSGGIVAGSGAHSATFSPVVSSDRVAPQDASSGLMADILTASGAFAFVAVVVALVVVVLKPTAPETMDMDNSSANLVKAEKVIDVSMDSSSTELISDSSKDFSYQDSLSAALAQRWEMNSEDDSVRL